jgi:hypothetical protein
MTHLNRLAVRAVRALLPGLVLGWCGAATAQKTDIITLLNGDTITCEIKELDRGKLHCSTDAMSDVYIKWEYIAGIDTDKTLEIELESGQRYYGSIQPGEDDSELAVSVGAASTAIPTAEVAFVKQINPTFWGRLDGNIDFGATFAQADNQLDYNLNAGSTYTAPHDAVGVSLSSLIKRRDDAATTNRQTLGGIWLHDLRWQRWFSIVLANFEHNEELDLDLRAVGGGGIGRYLAQTNRWTWSVYSAGVYSREEFADSDAGGNNIEAAFATDLQVFTFGDHDTDISTTFVFLPSITTPGRFRLSLNTAAKREVLKDFYFSVNLYETFDSEPPQVSAQKNDFGITMSFGWKY